MKKIIENLKNKPVEHRKNVMHLILFFAAIIFFFLWILTLSKSFSNESVKEGLKNDLKPVNVLRDNLVDGYRSVTDRDSQITTENNPEDYPRVIEINNTNDANMGTDSYDNTDALILEEINDPMINEPILE
jgi:hypothetical protein